MIHSCPVLAERDLGRLAAPQVLNIAQSGNVPAGRIAQWPGVGTGNWLTIARLEAHRNHGELSFVERENAPVEVVRLGSREDYVRLSC
jgi:hypothetical protein